jgi:hypothetical protein
MVDVTRKEEEGTTEDRMDVRNPGRNGTERVRVKEQLVDREEWRPRVKILK